MGEPDELARKLPEARVARRRAKRQRRKAAKAAASIVTVGEPHATGGEQLLCAQLKETDAGDPPPMTGGASPAAVPTATALASFNNQLPEQRRDSIASSAPTELKAEPARKITKSRDPPAPSTSQKDPRPSSPKRSRPRAGKQPQTTTPDGPTANH